MGNHKNSLGENKEYAFPQYQDSIFLTNEAEEILDCNEICFEPKNDDNSISNHGSKNLLQF